MGGRILRWEFAHQNRNREKKFIKTSKKLLTFAFDSDTMLKSILAQFGEICVFKEIRNKKTVKKLLNLMRWHRGEPMFYGHRRLS